MQLKASFCLLLVTALLAITLSPEQVLAKRVPMGHPSLFVTLYASSDPRFDYVVVEDANTIRTLNADIDAKLYGIFDMIVLPEIRKAFVENANIYSDSYVESIRVYFDMNESRLDILIEKVPGEYGCNEESCAHRKVSVNVPAELKLTNFNNIGFSIAVYEETDIGGAYDQLVERILMKASTEAKYLFSEGASILEANKEKLLEDDTIIEHILLRQYEDISRITMLFLPSELGVASSAKKPIDVVITSNSYYERYWPSSLQQKSQDEPSLEMLQECEKRGIAREDCNDITILQSIPRQAALDKDAIEQERSALQTAYSLIGIGAAGAGIAAVVVIRKLK